MHTKKTLVFLLAAALALFVLSAFTACSTTHIEHAEIHGSEINLATWKSQAGTGEDATIEATTAPKADTNLGLK